MNIEEFWEVVEWSKEKGQGAREAQARALRDRLRSCNENQIVAFHRHYAQVAARANRNQDLYCAAAIIDGFWVSDDAFEWFGDWLISKGRVVFETALQNPEALAEVVDHQEICEFEEFSSIAPEVWEEKTGESMEAIPLPDEPNPENPTGPAWKDDEDLQRRFPILWTRFAANNK